MFLHYGEQGVVLLLSGEVLQKRRDSVFRQTEKWRDKQTEKERMRDRDLPCQHFTHFLNKYHKLEAFIKLHHNLLSQHDLIVNFLNMTS